jgi:hypothetical protein
MPAIAKDFQTRESQSCPSPIGACFPTRPRERAVPGLSGSLWLWPDAQILAATMLLMMMMMRRRRRRRRRRGARRLNR